MTESESPDNDGHSFISYFEYNGELILAALILAVPLIFDRFVFSIGILLNLNINYPITAAVFTVIISATVVLLIEASDRPILMAGAMKKNQYTFYKATFTRPVMLSIIGLSISTIASIFNLTSDSVLRELPVEYIVILVIYYFLLSSVISFLGLADYAVTTLFEETKEEVDRMSNDCDE
jgi:hypothetical protein